MRIPNIPNRLLESRRLLTFVLMAAVIWSLLSVPWGSGVVHTSGGSSAGQILKGMFTLDLSPSFVGLALHSSWTTISYAVAGITGAVAIGLPLGIIASGVLSSTRWSRLSAIGSVRLLLAFLRSIHELVWAWLLVIAIGLSPMAAVLALAIPYGGILGRIYAEILVDVPEGPLRSLKSTGASELKVLLYGRLPMALPDMLSYTLYRFECGIRSVAIMSFVGIAGLGYQIQLSLDDLLYGQVWTLLFFLIVIVATIDLWSSIVRSRLIS